MDRIAWPDDQDEAGHLVDALHGAGRYASDDADTMASGNRERRDVLVLLKVDRDERVDVVERTDGAVWWTDPAGQRHGPYRTLEDVLAAKPELLTLDPTVITMAVESTELNDEALAGLIRIPHPFRPVESEERSELEWGSWAYPQWEMFGTDEVAPFESWDIYLSLNGVTWDYLRIVETDEAFLVPSDVFHRHDFEDIGRLEWYAAGWSDATGESLTRWHGICFFGGPNYESGEGNALFRDDRPADELFWQLMSWSEALHPSFEKGFSPNQDLVRLSISAGACTGISDEAILSWVTDALGGPDRVSLDVVTVNGKLYDWTSAGWTLRPPEEDAREDMIAEGKSSER